MSNVENFGFPPTASYNVIYVYAIPDDDHAGLLKIGKTSVASTLSEKQLPNNCDVLVEAAKKRIDSETKTAKVKYQLLHVELAVKHLTLADGTLHTEHFADKNVIKLLKRSKFRVAVFEESGRDSEWVEVDLHTALRAIRAIKEGYSVLPNDSSIASTEYIAPPKNISLRKEQEENVVRTIDVFAHSDEMLWDCKMRYGKTITAYELIRRKGYKRVIVVTHRPAVEDGWREDHEKVFGGTEHVFEDRATGSSDAYSPVADLNNSKRLYDLVSLDKAFVYFASLQDLRGSERVNGKFPKNRAVFDLDWELIIVDEAHEGVETEKGTAVVEALRKPGSKLLRLSGTPYNILDKHGKNIYTWTYVDEQRAKNEWPSFYPDEPNPYADLPQMNILTFDLGEQLKNSYRFVTEDSAFSFREFFRVWTGDASKDFRPIPAGQQVGDFVHEADVWSFLDLISFPDEVNCYPFASETFRDMFRHTFWIVPGVKEAAALSRMLKEHPIFKSFFVANVAGDGDIEEPYDKALKHVKDAIANHDFTITLSCGKLTTGVTVPEWTGVMMLSGSANTSLSGYMQAIFRVQSPGCINGKQKENCYVFDFAPDRTLKVIAGVHQVSSRNIGGENNGRALLGEFLNYCPIIAVEGTVMRSFDVGEMIQQVKRMSIESVIRSGFEDDLIYKSDTGIVMDEADEAILKKLSDVLAPQKKRGQKNDFVVNEHGMSREEYELAEGGKCKSPRLRTPEEQDAIEKQKKQRAEQKKVFDLLRAVSIRLPLLFYGADADITEIIHLEDFVDIVDTESWEEFMPKGLTKDFFRELLRFYDEDVLVGAGLRIRKISKAADELPPTLRAEKIVSIINAFKNPDKETVLTPWRVVNMHLGDCIGGYNFYDEGYLKPIPEPRLIEQPLGTGDITADIFLNPDAMILEMNSKSGLYPLYMAYSIYKLKLTGAESGIPLEEAQRIWFETLRDNIFVLCKTEMAKLITIRTLAGYSGEKVNAICLPRLLDWLKDDEHRTRFARKLMNPNTWGKEGERMRFDAIIGNPPYQINDGGGTGSSAIPLYDCFVLQAKKIKPNYLSMIIPSRWFSGGKGLDEFRDEMLHDNRFRVLHDYPDAANCFPNVEIKGGVCYFLWDSVHAGLCTINTHNGFHIVSSANRPLLEEGSDVLIRHNEAVSIFRKVTHFKEASFMDLVSARRPFGLASTFRGFSSTNDSSNIKVYGNKCFGYLNESVSLVQNLPAVEKWKIFISFGYGAGEGYPHQIINKPFIGEPHSCCTETYLQIGAFDSKEVAENVISYIKTKFFRFLVMLKKNTQNGTRQVYQFVPMQDFSKSWTDIELYEKYGLSKQEIGFIEDMIKPMD